MGMCFPMLFNHTAEDKMPFWSSETENILKTSNILRKQCRCLRGKCEERLFPENFLVFGVLQHTRAAVEHWFSCLEKLVTNEDKNYRLFMRKKAGLESEEAERTVCLCWRGADSGKCFLLSRALLLSRAARMAHTGEGWERLSSQDK